jgi:hypothetical protein
MAKGASLGSGSVSGPLRLEALTHGGLSEMFWGREQRAVLGPAAQPL